MADDHPSPDSPDWNSPDFCPFCGVTLRDGGAGFVEHAEENGVCRRRFDEWCENVGGEGSG